MATTPRIKKSFTGHCHCGSIIFNIVSDFPELTTCNCSICSLKNALMVKVHEDDFVLVAGEEMLTEYQFHTHTAKHYFCKKCGIYPFHRKRTAPEFYGVNVRCLEDADLEGISVRETNGITMS